MAESTRRRGESRGYKAALTGIKGIVRILITVCLVIVLIYLGRRAYALGREAFDEQPVDIGEGRTVIVTITDEMSVYDIGRMLRAEGLLTESPAAFWLQEFLSEYHGDLMPGTYTLKTSMTTQEMFPILSQETMQEQNITYDVIAPGMQQTEEEES